MIILIDSFWVIQLLLYILFDHQEVDKKNIQQIASLCVLCVVLGTAKNFEKNKEK